MSERRAPNPEQQQAISFGAGPLRIMAGAGTGKTHTLTQRIARLVAEGHARPEEILALTFTTKAAEELAERVAAAVGNTDDPARRPVDVDTYHAFGGRVVAEHGRLLDLPPEPIVLTPPEAWILLWRALDEIDFQHIDLTYLRGSQFMASPLYAMINLGSRLSDELRTLEDLAAHLNDALPGDATETLRDYARGLATYRARKRAIGAIDYGDQIELACELLDRPEVAGHYRSRYRYLLVDEFQDTNYSQSVLVRRLTGDPTGNVCVVGDPNQAIYGFRGAAPDNLDRFADQEFPAAETIALFKNFRSTQAILDVANRIWDDAPGDYRGNLIASSVEPYGERPRLVTCDALADEIAFIADEIGRLVAAGRTYDHIMILVRKNAMKQKLFRALRQRRIPVEAVGGTSLYETADVREVISYLRAIGDPADDPSVAHVLCAERWGMDERTLYEIAQGRRHGEPLIAAARRLAQAETAPPLLNACLESLATLTARAYRIGLRRLIDEIIGLRMGGYDEVERANIAAFSDVVRRFAENRVERPDLRDLLAYIDLLLAAGPEEEAALEEGVGERNTVKIMTAHGAKGLESPVVFVAGANKNDFYNSRPRPDVLPAELAHPAEGQPRRAEFAAERDYEAAIKAWRKEQQDLEERRVLYVALTRAQERLYITWSRIDPSRVRETALLPALVPAAELCDAVAAPSAADAAPGAPAFRQIAPRLLGNASGALESSGDAIAETLSVVWRQEGGGSAALATAAATFIREREETREQIAIIQAVARRHDADEVAAAGNRIISYSQLETHRACPHRYYLRYVAGLPGFPDRRAAAIGTAFHAAIATEAQRRSDGIGVAPEQVAGWFAAELARDPIAGATPSAAGGAGGDPIAAYLASPDATAEPLLVEAEFSLRLGGAILNGVIDRVHRLPSGEVEVVDYKTDRQPRTPEEVKAGWQLPLYLLACREVFPQIQPAPSRATMFFVRSNRRITVDYTDAELEAVRRDLVEHAAEAQAVRPEDHRAGPSVCVWCEYRQICRYAVAG